MNPESAPSPSSLAASPRARAGADVVLVVGDTPDDLAPLIDALDEAGYGVLSARTGEAALQLAARALPDIVLLDAATPGLDGFGVARGLQADPATAAIPIVFMTAPGAAGQVVAAFGAGGSDCVSKPIRPREVLARVAAQLQRGRAQRQARHALDAFGHATLVVRERDGRRVWQTALARGLLAEHFGGDEAGTPPEVIAWVAREALRRRAGAEPHSLTVARGARRITFALHALPEHSVDPGAGGEWLLVMRGSDDGPVVEALSLTLGLGAREAEVLYWLVKGREPGEIGAILGTSPCAVASQLEHICVTLGVQTASAAAALATARVKDLARG